MEVLRAEDISLSESTSKMLLGAKLCSQMGSKFCFRVAPRPKKSEPGIRSCGGRLRRNRVPGSQADTSTRVTRHYLLLFQRLSGCGQGGHWYPGHHTLFSPLLAFKRRHGKADTGTRVTLLFLYTVSCGAQSLRSFSPVVMHAYKLDRNRYRAWLQ